MAEITGRVTRVNRLTNTVNGNPRWSVHLDSGSYRTVPDSQVSYDLHEGWVGREVKAVLDGQSRIVKLEEL